MTQSPNPGSEPSSNQPNPNPNPPRRSRRLQKILLPVGGVLLAGIVGGTWWGWVFVHEQLAPLVEKTLSKSLKRPVRLGKVERFTPTSLRIGPSSLPATPTDPDQISIQAIEVRFNPLKILLTQNLNLDITAENPKLYVEQDKKGVWISTELEPEDETKPAKTDVERIQFRNAEAVLVPWAKSGKKLGMPVKLEGVNGNAKFLDQNRRIDFELTGRSPTGGEVKLMGETLRIPASKAVPPSPSASSGANLAKPTSQTQTNLQVQAQNFLISDLDRLVKLPVDLTTGRLNANVKVEVRPQENIPSLTGTAAFKDATLKIPQVPASFSQAKGSLQLRGKVIRLEDVTTRFGKIPIAAKGDVNLDKDFNLSAKMLPVSIPEVIETLKLAVPIPITGTVRGDLKVTGPLAKPILAGVVQNTKALRVDRVDVSRLSAKFQLNTKRESLTITNIEAIPTAGGRVTAEGRIGLGKRSDLAFDFRAVDVPGENIARAYVGKDALPFSVGLVNLRGQVTGTPTIPLVNLASVLVTPPDGGQITGSGQIRLGQAPLMALNFQASGVPGDAIARAYNNGNALPVTVGRINAIAAISGSFQNPQALVRWQAVEGSCTGSGEIALVDSVFVIRDTVLNVAGGTINAEARAAEGRWRASIRGAQIGLSQFSKDLRGRFSGDLALSGIVASFKPADIRAEGRVNLSQGVSVVGEPLTADIRWDGEKVVIQRATAPGLGVAGFLYPQLEGAGAPALAGLDLNVRMRGYNLQKFLLPLPVSAEYSGQVDFEGRVTGSPAAPNVAGGLNLRQFVVNGLAFEPLMSGQVQVKNGVNLNVAGKRDHISLQLDSAYQPVAFDIKRDEAIATGKAQGDQLLVHTSRFPIAIINGLGIASLPNVGGELTGDLAVNLNKRSVDGEVAIANLAIGTYRTDKFAARVRFSDGVASLQGAELKRGETIIQIDGTATVLGDDPKVKGKIKVAKGRVQDVLELAQIFELTDLVRGTKLPTYGSKDDLFTSAIDLTNASVLDRLRRLAEVKALLEQAKARRQESPLPELRELTGFFEGEITADASLKGGVNANFKVLGQNWKWGPYLAKQVIAIGSLEKGVLTLVPLRIQSDQSFLAFSGQIGGTQQSGQFRMENVPIEAIRDLAAASIGGQVAQSLIAVNVEGNLNATATLAGSLDNPQAIGRISLTNGILNGTAMQSAQGSFSYTNARLDFGSNILITGTDPLSISGSLPYQLPFAAVEPDSDQIALDVNVKDEGLALLNLFNNQVTWVKGKGAVKLTVRGTILRPDANGFIRIEDGTIAARALPEPLTNVNASILFNRDRLRVEKLTGQFSKGRISAAGPLPIFLSFQPNDPDYGKAIAINLQDIALNLKGLYRGGVRGDVEVAGTALDPKIGGIIHLSNGEVLLSDPPEGGSSDNGVDLAEGSSFIEFNNLKLELGDSVRVTRAPILNFVARGELIINGGLNELRPQGTIRLTAGQVNLFTTQFTLARGYPQQAEFVAEQGLDPNLNVLLIASVPEAVGTRQPTSALNSEIQESNLPTSSFGGLQTVRIQARVRGAASQIFDNLELTSSPPRSKSEIVSLIGGGFVATLGRGDSALGIANLAGSALLTNVQTVIGNALGLSEFRLFPTLVRDTKKKDSRAVSSTLGLAAEAAIDITPKISISALKILTSSDPTQFGVRYRLNSQLLLRGSSDFSGDSRLVIEYETRF